MPPIPSNRPFIPTPGAQTPKPPAAKTPAKPPEPIPPVQIKIEDLLNGAISDGTIPIVSD